MQLRLLAIVRQGLDCLVAADPSLRSDRYQSGQVPVASFKDRDSTTRGPMLDFQQGVASASFKAKVEAKAEKG